MDSFSDIVMKQLAAAISFFLLLHYLSSTNGTVLKSSASNLVDCVCKQTQNYVDCFSSGSRSLNSINIRPAENCGKNCSRDSCSNHKQTAKLMLKKMAKNKRTAPSLRPALKNGAWGYWHAAMASFDCARMELYQDVTKANYDAKAASDGAVFCETWLNITKWNIPSIRLRNYYISLFSDIGYSITDMLDG